MTNQNPFVTFLVIGIGVVIGSYAMRRLLGGSINKPPHFEQPYQYPSQQNQNVNPSSTANVQDPDSK
jgi:hypothetical protein